MEDNEIIQSGDLKPEKNKKIEAIYNLIESIARENKIINDFFINLPTNTPNLIGHLPLRRVLRMIFSIAAIEVAFFQTTDNPLKQSSVQELLLRAYSYGIDRIFELPEKKIRSNPYLAQASWEDYRRGFYEPMLSEIKRLKNQAKISPLPKVSQSLLFLFEQKLNEFMISPGNFELQRFRLNSSFLDKGFKNIKQQFERYFQQNVRERKRIIDSFKSILEIP